MAEPVISEVPDGGWGWMIVLAGFLNNCLLVGITRSFGVFFIQFTQYFGETSSRVSWITSIAMAMQQFASPVGSVFGMHYGARPVVMVGGVLASLGMLTASFGQSLLHMYLSIGLLTGFLADATGSYSSSFMTAGGFILVGSLALLFLPSFLVRPVVLSGKRTGDPAGAGAGGESTPAPADVTGSCRQE